jgi:hypothetical protein
VGTTENFHTTLGPAKWYFRMKVLDDAPAGWSALSNELILDMRYMGDCGCDGLFAGSGDAGGGSSAQRVANQASAQQETASHWGENSLLDGIAPSQHGSDFFRLDPAPTIVNGACRVRLRSTSGHSAALDAVRLMIVDHPADAEVFGAASGVIAGSTAVPLHASAAHDTDLTVVLNGSDIYVAAPQEAITVRLDADAGLSALLVIEVACFRPGTDPDSTGILLQVPDQETGWRTLRHLHPRRVLDALAVDSIPGPTVRLLCLDMHYLRFVGRLSRASESPTVHWGTLTSASSTRFGDGRTSVAAVDSLSATFTGPDTLMLAFAMPQPTEGSTRDYFLAVDATSLDSREQLLGRAIPVRAAVPTQFALRQNQPNPFAALTTIRFELPVGAMVRLDVFDPQGRRIRKLASRYFPGGYHSLAWDHRNDDGRALGPGVYFYRIEAGPFHDRKKMVLVP